jgi:hypothetical protein
MHALAVIAVFLAVAWTAFVIFANMMKGAQTGGFIGLNTLVVAWGVVALIALTAFGS